jgi:hypothetical protein
MCVFLSIMSYYYVTGNESSRSGLRGLQNVRGMSKSRRSLLWLVFLGKQVRHHTHREILRKRAAPGWIVSVSNLAICPCVGAV